MVDLGLRASQELISFVLIEDHVKVMIPGMKTKKHYKPSLPSIDFHSY